MRGLGDVLPDTFAMAIETSQKAQLDLLRREYVNTLLPQFLVGASEAARAAKFVVALRSKGLWISLTLGRKTSTEYH